MNDHPWTYLLLLVIVAAVLAVMHGLTLLLDRWRGRRRRG
jgi:hypothetical protein